MNDQKRECQKRRNGFPPLPAKQREACGTVRVYVRSTVSITQLTTRLRFMRQLSIYLGERAELQSEATVHAMDHILS